MNERILITGPRMLRDMERLRPLFADFGWELVLADVRQCLSEDDLLELVGDIDGTICGGDKWTARVMDAAPRLRAICKWGTGIDAIDQTAAAARGIAVRNVPDAFSVPVADTVFAFMLSFARRTPWIDRRMKQGEWAQLDGRSLAECSLGVVGVGNIGQTALRRARAFGMKCYGCDPRPVPLQVIDDTGVEMVEFDRLLAESDFVSLHCDLNPTSLRLMSDMHFAMMKKDAVLINTSRGPVVDEAALVRALQSGAIAGAGLDVFEVEPLPQNSPLLGMDNVILTPHLANSSERAAWRVHERTIRNIAELLETVPARTAAATYTQEMEAAAR
ncbi:MAG: dihydrofolate reductase [Phycisphaeraceae bacterium]|nr:MAG: dihydrofolate reductase [Phycisphaeraceae bacterium]